MNFVDVLSRFQADDQTKGIVMVGENRRVARKKMQQNTLKLMLLNPSLPISQDKPHLLENVWGMLVQLLTGGKGTAAGKIAALKAAGIEVCVSPTDIGVAMKGCL